HASVFVRVLHVPGKGQQQQRLSQGKSNTALGRWFASLSRRRLGFVMRLRFPNFSVSLVLLLIPGIVRAVTTVIQDITGNVNGGPAGLDTAAVTIGVVFVVCGAACVETCVYRHIDSALVTKASTQQRNDADGYSPMIQFVIHQRSPQLFAPIPRRISRILLPRGRWEPEFARKTYAGIVAALSSQWRRLWCFLPTINILVQILGSIGGSDTVCDAVQSLTMIVLACACVFFAVARPHRALLASYLTCVSLLLSCVVTLLAMLCRLGSVDRSVVDGFGVFVSVAMMIMKAYHVALPHVEGWLIDRSRNLNGATVLSKQNNVDQSPLLDIVIRSTPSGRDVDALSYHSRGNPEVTLATPQSTMHAEVMLRRLIAIICDN
ncbi:GP46-like surface antigen, putative, partial [Bodo saltans]